MHGTRDAALNWSMAYGKVLEKLEFTKGASSPCTFFNEKRGIKMAVHGDDFIVEGSEGQLKWLAEQLQKEFEIKYEILGAAAHLAKTTTLLNRVVEWRLDGISWEPDPRQIELIVRDFGLVGGEHAVTPGIREHSKRR